MTSTSNKGDSRRKRLTPEARLANHWRKKTGLPWVQFDVFQGEPPAGTRPGRSHWWIYDPHSKDPGPYKDDLAVLKRELLLLVFGGHPLNFAEYHLAIAFGYLLVDGIPYEEFYRKRWFENATHFGYGKPPRVAKTGGAKHGGG